MARVAGFMLGRFSGGRSVGFKNGRNVARPDCSLSSVPISICKDIGCWSKNGEGSIHGGTPTWNGYGKSENRMNDLGVPPF